MAITYLRFLGIHGDFLFVRREEIANNDEEPQKSGFRWELERFDGRFLLKYWKEEGIGHRFHDVPGFRRTYLGKESKRKAFYHLSRFSGMRFTAVGKKKVVYLVPI